MGLDEEIRRQRGIRERADLWKRASVAADDPPVTPATPDSIEAAERLPGHAWHICRLGTGPDDILRLQRKRKWWRRSLVQKVEGFKVDSEDLPGYLLRDGRMVGVVQVEVLWAVARYLA